MQMSVGLKRDGVTEILVEIRMSVDTRELNKQTLCRKVP